MIARRDTREKQPVAMDGLVTRVRDLLAEMQHALLAKALAFREAHTHRADSYGAFKETMEGRPGFVIASWCGSADCEAQIKAETQATIRNMPLDAGSPGGHCVRCESPAVTEAWFAKSY